MRRARKTFFAMGIAIALIAGSVLGQARPLLVWNASPSVPAGLYAVQSLDAPAIGDLVVVTPPPALGDWLAARGYLGADVPLLKHVAALPGQRVCRTGVTVSVDGVAVATAKVHDRMNRPLPVWQGCHRLAEGQVFFLNAAEPASLDGRYFGPLLRDTIVGRAAPLWTQGD